MSSITWLNAVKNADKGDAGIKPYAFSTKELGVFSLLIS